MQDEYPDVNFLLLDGEPHSADYAEYRTAANTHCILYREEQAGFFAGYAAVKEGYTELGFAGGMAVPAVIRFGYGFIQGADAAAQELGVNANVKFWFADSFAPSDDIKTKAASWYTEGTEVIFSCGGGICTSIIAAAEEGGGKVIGVDSDQYYLSDVVITSAMKDLPHLRAALPHRPVRQRRHLARGLRRRHPDPRRGGELRGPAHCGSLLAL